MKPPVYVEIRALPEGPEKERALTQAVARAERVRTTVPPPARAAPGLLCGCTPEPAIGPSAIDNEGGCYRCAP